MDNYNYPMGADTKDAPWNEGQPTREFEINVEYSLNRTVIITTDDYVLDEDGHLEYLDNDTEGQYKAEYFTPLQIIEDMKRYLPIIKAHYKEMGDGRELNHLAFVEDSLDGWVQELEGACET